MILLRDMKQEMTLSLLHGITKRPIKALQTLNIISDFFYAQGCTVHKTYHLAFANFQIAADKGNIGAQHNLGMVYQKGRDVAKNVAIAFYQKTADKGDAQA